MSTPITHYKPKRIVLAVSSLAAGGAERVISEMANWWSVRDRKVCVLTIDNRLLDHYRLHPHVERIIIDWGLPRTRLHIPAQLLKRRGMLRDAIVDYKPDVLISFIDRTNLQILFALVGSGIPLIVSERIDPRYYRIGCSWSLARRILYPFSSAIVVQTSSVIAWANKIAPRRKVRVIPNFVRKLPEPYDMSVQAEQSQRIMLAVGRLDKQKGYDLLIRAFARVDAKRKGWRLVILGEGPERSNLWRLAEDLGIHDAVAMPGIVKEPAEWMHKADLFVLPSRYEGFPNALLEAMACGCAVIAADCPSGPAEIIHNGVNGLLVPREDITALSAAMDRLMQDEELRVNLGKQAIEINSRFSRAKIMAQWDDLIESVCISPK